MTTRLIAALVALVATQASFEGKIRMRTITAQLEEERLQEGLLDMSLATLLQREGVEQDSSVVLFKGGVVRSEDGGEGGFALWDIGSKKVIMIQPSQRSYMEWRLDSMIGPGQGTKPGARAGQRAKPQVRSLGQTRTINGMKTTGYEFRGEEVVIRAWMTQDYPGLTWALRSVMEQVHDDSDDAVDPEEAANRELAQYGFPVLIITLTPGSIEFEETLSIERTSLNPELFKVPAGYTKRILPTNPEP